MSPFSQYCLDQTVIDFLSESFSKVEQCLDSFYKKNKGKHINVVIGFDTDMDGMTSAGLIKMICISKLLRNENDNISISLSPIGHGKNSEQRLQATLNGSSSSDQAKLFFITDVALSLKMLEDIEGQENTVIWIDHHSFSVLVKEKKTHSDKLIFCNTESSHKENCATAITYLLGKHLGIKGFSGIDMFEFVSLVNHYDTGNFSMPEYKDDPRTYDSMALAAFVFKEPVIDKNGEDGSCLSNHAHGYLSAVCSVIPNKLEKGFTYGPDMETITSFIAEGAFINRVKNDAIRTAIEKYCIVRNVHFNMSVPGEENAGIFLRTAIIFHSESMDGIAKVILEEASPRYAGVDVVAICYLSTVDGAHVLKTSLRCRKNDPIVRVDRIAEYYGGGGHASAAGFMTKFTEISKCPLFVINDNS